MVSPIHPDSEAIRRLLQRINAAWREGRVEELYDCFHEKISVAPPGFQTRVEGREPCVQSYRDFLSQAVVKEYTESEPVVDVWENTAVATYRWEMTWEMGGQTYRESGHDLFVFSREAGRWWAVWRTIVPSPSKDP
jgi:hypothetical protein